MDADAIRSLLAEQFEELRSRQALDGLLREQNATLLEENLRGEDERLALVQEIDERLRENHSLRERILQLEKERYALGQHLGQIQQSLGWTVIQRARRAKRLVIRENGLSGRAWRAMTRRIRFLASASPRALARKASRRLLRSLPFVSRRDGHDAGSPLAHLATPATRGLRFEDLPWDDRGERPLHRTPGQGAFKILLVSHSACRTGAPLCLLRLAQELQGLPEFDCRIVLQRDGALQDEFARVAPTLDMGRLIERGVPDADVPAAIAALFRRYTSRGIAICNTMAVSRFHEAFNSHGVPVLSWIHELPSMVHLNGGGPAVERVKSASRRIVVPADVVRDAWIRKFAVEPEQIVTLRYGIDPRGNQTDRAAARAQIRHELGIPEDGLIVISCGTVDPRKGADLFAQVARKIFTRAATQDVAEKTWFVWVGDSPLPFFHQWLTHDTELDGFPGRVVFTGEKPDALPYLLAADVFLLTSREDPCPFANLEAMECGLPVIVFDEAGGAPEVIGGGGIAVPYLDTDAMAAALGDLLRDPQSRATTGNTGRDMIHRGFTWPGLLRRLRSVLQVDYNVFPPVPKTVTAIVPNYRHAPYLEERLRSLFRQTVRPDEILVLDDASPDDSLEVIRRLMPESPVPIRLIVNEANSGSTFRQWAKGLEHAAGDLIWLAESDDSCHPEFLERLLPAFNDPEVALAYCQSELIGADGRRLEAHFLGHTDDISPARWRSPYCVSGEQELEQALSQKNTIPNASAMVFRRPPQLAFMEELFGLKFAGDWLFHATLSRGGKVAYLPDVLNRYRRHEQTVSHRAIQSETYLSETLLVKRRVFESAPVSPQAITRSLAQTAFEYHRLHPGDDTCPVSCSDVPGVQENLARIRGLIGERSGARSSLRILLVLGDLRSNLESLAEIHVANALAFEHPVFVCLARPDCCDPAMLQRLDPRLLLLEGRRVRRCGCRPSLRALAGTTRRSGSVSLRNWSDCTRSTSLTRDPSTRTLLHASSIDELVYPGSPGWVISSRPPTPDSPTPSPIEVGFGSEGIRQVYRDPNCREGEFVVAIPEATAPRWLRFAAMVAVRVINRLPEVERGGLRVRLLIGDEAVGSRRRHVLSRLRRGIEPPPLPEGCLEALASCDAVLFSGPPIDSGPGAVLRVACLGLGIPSLTPDGKALDSLVRAILQVLTDQDQWQAQSDAARALFERHHSAGRVAGRCSATYLAACDPLAMRRAAAPPIEASGSHPARQSA